MISSSHHDLTSANRIIEPTRSAPAQPAGALSSFSSQDHRGTSGTTSDQAGGEEAAPFTADDLGLVPVPSCSPRIHARDARAVTSGQLGVGEVTTARFAGPELAPVLVVCKRCREPIFRNEILRISFCRMHEDAAFDFIPLTQRRFSGV